MANEITMTEDEFRQKLESALDAGRVIADQEAARGPSRDQLMAEYKERVAALRLSGKQTPAKGRLLEQEFIDKGLSEQDVDLNPPQPDWRGHQLGDGPPPSR